jgi:hypothetical protein
MEKFIIQIESGLLGHPLFVVSSLVATKIIGEVSLSHSWTAFFRSSQIGFKSMKTPLTFDQWWMSNLISTKDVNSTDLCHVMDKCFTKCTERNHEELFVVDIGNRTDTFIGIEI